MSVDVLGPLRVDGDVPVLGPRDRVVLQALVVHVGETVSADRLADALWPNEPPATWAKVVQGCIMRLRKTLGTDAIVTTPFGYRLCLSHEDIDSRRFEHLAGRSRELMTFGEHERASFVGREALALWRGMPLADLEHWDPGMLEARRLSDLRLDVEETTLDAALRAGRFRDVLGEAQAAVAKAPLRERRWELLALAQYQAGRQGDALRTLHDARRVLVDELGVDPGPDLVALEHAILTQDPSLLAAPALPSAQATCPYLGLVAYDLADSDAFFGRAGEIADCRRRLVDTGTLTIVGPSGCGKSSLARAGVAAMLRREGRRVVVVTPGTRPLDALTAIAADSALIVDQCEEAFTLCDDAGARSRFLEALVAHAGRAPLIVTMRADHLPDVAAHPSFARLVERGMLLLGSMGDANLRAAIEGPARQAGLLLESGLVDVLVHETEHEPGALPLLSHALRETWERREGRTLTVAGYHQTGGIRGAVAKSAEAIYEQSSDEQRSMLRDLMVRLVAPSSAGEPTRIPARRAAIVTGADRERLVGVLVDARLLTTDGETVEIAHESLATAWPRMRTWLDDDVDGQRILRHLAVTADNWDAMGRPDSELYRGARLAQALDWRDRAAPDLTPVERSFVEASADNAVAEERSAEQRAREQARANRRLRVSLAAVGVLLALALVAGALAIRAANRADRSAVEAEARRISALALASEDVDRAMLLAAEAVELDDSTETRAGLLTIVSRSPAIVGSIRAGHPLREVAASPRGDLLVVSDPFEGTAFHDPETFDVLGTLAEPARQLEFSPSGDQLALTANEWTPQGTQPDPQPLVLIDPATLEAEADQLGGLPGEGFYAWDTSYSGDGSRLAASFHATLTTPEPNVVLVWDLSAVERPIARIVLSGGDGTVVLSPDGETLYVGTADVVRAYDVATGAELRSFGTGGFVISVGVDAEGRRLVVGTDTAVVIVDAITGDVVHRLDAHAMAAPAQFSHDGSLVATSGSPESRVVLWDAETGRRLDELVGHVTVVFDIAFADDDATLYTVSQDRSLLAWDLTDERRFLRRSGATKPPDDVLENGADVIISPTGEHIVYTRSVDNLGLPVGMHLQFRATESDQWSARLDVDHGGVGTGTWRPDGAVFASAGWDGQVRVWRSDGDAVSERAVSEGPFADVEYTGDGRRIVVAEVGGAIRTLDAVTLEPVADAVMLDRSIVQLVLGPDGRTAAVVDDDRSVAFVDISSGDIVSEIPAGMTADTVAFAPDGRAAVVSGNVGDVGVVDVASGHWLVAPSTAHRSSAHAVAFAADGTMFVTGGADGRVILWDAATGREFGSVAVAAPGVEVTPQFRPDGASVLIATPDGATYTWDIRMESWIDHACRAAARNFTEAEWQEYFGDEPYRETCELAGA